MSDFDNLPPQPEDVDDMINLEAEAEDLGLLLPPVPDTVSDIGEVAAKNWRDYPDIVTDSLWIIPARRRVGVHTGKYHGNFVPQIPYQAIRRFTKPGDVVLDTFLGSGTTLIECRHLGRHGLGIELMRDIAAETQARIDGAENPHNTWQTVIQGDSANPATFDGVREALTEKGHKKVQLLIMHPPYHDIIKFSEDPRDLCNADTMTDFLTMFQQVVSGSYDLLADNHFLVVVIGDKYSQKEWVPLGFETMAAVRAIGYRLKSIIVKNMDGNRAKRNLQNLWRQRAFRGDYYIFKHEYVFFFQKVDSVIPNLQKVIDFVKELDAKESFNLVDHKTFASGILFQPHFNFDQATLTAQRILVLKHNGRPKAVVINLTGLTLNPTWLADLRQFLQELPPTIVDISVVAEEDKKRALQEITGISHLCPPTETALQHLAHALYIICKTLASAKSRKR